MDRLGMARRRDARIRDAYGTFTREDTWDATRRELPELATLGVTIVTRPDESLLFTCLSGGPGLLEEIRVDRAKVWPELAQALVRARYDRVFVLDPEGL